MAKFKKFIPFTVLLLALLPLIWPLLTPGFMRTDDGGLMVTRLSAFHLTLKTGQFPVRFLELLNHQYGYPVLNFLYPLPFYLGEMLHLMRFGFIDSVKLLFVFSFIGSAYTMFLLIRREWGEWSGLVAAVFYVYFPYRIHDVYVRGSLGESIAFVFLPLTFYLFEVSFQKRTAASLAIAGLALAALITAHNVIAFLALPALALLGFFKWRQNKLRQDLIWTVAFVVLGLSISAFFWAPALLELGYIRAGTVVVANFQNYFLSPINYLTLVGPLLPPIIIGTIWLLFYKRESKLWLVSLICLGSLFLATPISELFWKLLPLPRLVQFPWRFLALTCFSAAIIVGRLVAHWPGRLNIFAILMIIFLGSSVLKVDKTFYSEDYYSLSDSTTTVKNEYLPIWVKNDELSAPESYLDIISGEGTIESIAKVTAASPLTLRINRVYYPGWKVWVDGQEVPISTTDNGVIEFNVSPGKHIIASRFTETWPRLLADLVSAVAILISVGLIVRNSHTASWIVKFLRFRDNQK